MLEISSTDVVNSSSQPNVVIPELATRDTCREFGSGPQNLSEVTPSVEDSTDGTVGEILKINKPKKPRMIGPLTEDQAKRRDEGIAASQERRKARAAERAAAKKRAEAAPANEALHQQAVDLLAEIKLARGQAKSYNERRRETTEKLRPILTAVWEALERHEPVGGCTTKGAWAKAQGITTRHVEKIIAGPKAYANSVRIFKLPQDGNTIKFDDRKHMVVSTRRSDENGEVTLTISLKPLEPKKYKAARDVYWVPPANPPAIKGWSKMNAFQKLTAARAAGCDYCNTYNSARSCPVHGWKEKRSWASRSIMTQEEYEQMKSKLTTQQP